MLVKSRPKVSLKSRLNRQSNDAKFGMDECARNNYGVTLNLLFAEQRLLTFVVC